MVRRRWISILLAMLVCVVVERHISLAKSQPASASGLKWQPTLEDAKRVAAQSNRLILVHFWAPSCKECVQLEKDVYSQSHVQQAIDARFVPLKLNSDDFPTTTKQYGVDRLPTDLIITPAGQIVGRMKCPLTADAYLQQLNIAASGVGMATQMASAPAAAAPSAPPTASMVAAQSPVAPPLNAAPGQPPIAAPSMALNPQTSTFNQPVMSNPAWAVQPPAQTAQPPIQPAAQPAPGAVATSPPAKGPANPAYSDERYSDYFRRFPSSSGAVATTSPPTATAPAAQAPVASLAAAAPPVNAAPQTASAVPQYTSPPANPVQYTSPAIAQSPAATTAAVGWPATPAPAMTSAAATQPYTGASIAGSPSGTLTGVAASAPAPAPAATPPATQAASTAAPPPLGLDGYCPVSLADQKRWQVGDRRYGVIHRGRTYLFAGPVEQQKFLQNPDHYSPAISGQDVVMALDQGQTVDGHRQYGVQYQGRTYLFASDASRRAFSQNPTRYAAEVLQAENPNRPPLR